MPQLDVCLLPSSETSSVRNGLNLVESFTKGDPWKPQTSQAIAMASRCPPQIDGKALLLKKTPTYLMGFGKDKLVPNWAFNPTDRCP